MLFTDVGTAVRSRCQFVVHYDAGCLSDNWNEEGEYHHIPSTDGWPG